ncbi:unnamed protein product, partial [Candidula unifasciata]
FRDVQQNAKCLDDHRLFDTIAESAKDCILDSKPSSGKHYSECREARIAQWCTVRSYFAHCGQAAGELAFEISERILNSSPRYQCPSTDPHNDLKRGFDLLGKRFV